MITPYHKIHDQNDYLKIESAFINTWHLGETEYFAINLKLHNVSGNILEQNDYKIEGSFYIRTNQEQISANEQNWESESILPNLHVLQSFSFTSDQKINRKDLIIVQVKIQGQKYVLATRIGNIIVKSIDEDQERPEPKQKKKSFLKVFLLTFLITFIGIPVLLFLLAWLFSLI